MDSERVSFLALHLVPGVGDILIRQLVNYCGSAEEVFRQSKGRLLKIPGIGEITAEAIRQRKLIELAEMEFRIAEREQTEILFFTDNAYPARLKHIEDAPSVLYVKGNVNLNQLKAVAIVGTRKATAYGKKQVEQLMEGLAVHKPVIISGLAYGIDIHAHKEAMKHGLQTIGVLGSGLDVIYPSIHTETARKMTNHGGLVTENPFGTQPDAHNFPARNRIIAGLCDALVVAEAALSGGALITAEIANSYNKDVFAIPGNVGHEFSEGCNKLIKINKANLLTSANDIEYIMNWKTAPLIANQLPLELSGYDSDEQIILNALMVKNDAMSIDELSVRTGLDPGKLASLLLNLEFRDAVISLPGKMYCRR